MHLLLLSHLGYWALLVYEYGGGGWSSVSVSKVAAGNIKSFRILDWAMWHCITTMGDEGK